MRFTFLKTIVRGALLAIAFSRFAHAADSCDPIHTFADGEHPLREIFVSPSGSNSTGEGTQSNPYQTISRALQGVRAGDAIRLLPGNHAAGTSIRNIAGTSNAPIW